MIFIGNYLYTLTIEIAAVSYLSNSFSAGFNFRSYFSFDFLRRIIFLSGRMLTYRMWCRLIIFFSWSLITTFLKCFFSSLSTFCSPIKLSWLILRPNPLAIRMNISNLMLCLLKLFSYSFLKGRCPPKALRIFSCTEERNCFIRFSI